MSIPQAVLHEGMGVHVELVVAVEEPVAVAPGARPGGTGHQELDNEALPSLG